MGAHLEPFSDKILKIYLYIKILQKIEALQLALGWQKPPK